MIKQFMVAAALLVATQSANAKEVTFKTTDGKVIYADELVSPSGLDAPLMILFHQAGANGRAEYKNTAPHFQEMGFSLLVVDQSSGGDRFGGANRTVQARGESAGYCAAYPDLEAAINYAELKGYGGAIFAAGSSYSAGLVIRLGAEYGDMLNGVIAFSPASGGPMKDCSPNGYASETNTPTMIVRPEREMEVPSVQEQFTLFKTHDHTMFVHKGGVHGSSTLDSSRTKTDTSAAWAAIKAFLEENS